MNLPIAFEYDSEYFNVRDTLECGQIFRFEDLGCEKFAVYSQDKYAELETVGNKVVVRTQDKDYFWHFFDLDTDYAEKVKRISSYSSVMKDAAQFGKGIRILNQDLTEMIFSFIISANNNIKRIQLIIGRLCAQLGSKMPHGYAFPTVDDMARQSVEFYTGIGAGYRDKYLLETAQRLLTYDLNTLRNLDSCAARKELQGFKGVGPKVADCILLFGLKRGDVFPVDTWLKKVYHNFFENGHKNSEISGYFCSLFGSDAGLCQQYLFYFQRKYRQIK